jgi:hypothetical protein
MPFRLVVAAFTGGISEVLEGVELNDSFGELCEAGSDLKGVIKLARTDGVMTRDEVR